MSFLKKFQRNRKSSETGSIGSSLSINSLGINKGPINTTYSVNEKELPPFLKAIWRNDISKVKKLMKKNYSTVDKEQRSGLHLACAMGSLDIAHELLGNYCNELLEKRDSCGRTGVFKAVENGSLNCVRLLIEKGAKLDIRDSFGDSVVHAAVKHKHLEILEFLLDEGYDCISFNNDGMAPIHLAVTLNYIASIELLISHDVDINQPNLCGKTALIMAAESGNYNMMKELLSKNADIAITDNEGKNAHFYADFHQYGDCAQQLESFNIYDSHKTPPRRPTPLQMPDFIVSQNSETKKVNQSPPKPTSRTKNSKEEQATKNNVFERRRSQDSINSYNSWSKEMSQYSSDTTLPIGKNNHLQDVSTPSSMPNPSEDTFNPLRPLSNGISKTPISKHVSEDEESQWTDSEVYKEPTATQQIKNDLGPQVFPEKRVGVVEITKNSDSDWDTDTEIEKHGGDGILSTIEEEKGRKKDIKFPKSDDDHQTDSNIDECYNSNYQILNKPVRYDSNDALENSFDYDEEEDTELSQTKIPNHNFRENNIVSFSKPPVSPITKTENIPIITIDDVGVKRKGPKSSNGDNLSYSSTDISSKHESSLCSDNLTEFDRKNVKFTEDYIKKCSSMESKLRVLESERDNLQRDIKNVNESKRKLEAEHSKLYKDFQKNEVMLSERKDELDEFKSKFIISEELLKTREKELFEAKKINQDLVGSRNDMEMKNIAYNSKINQLQQEITNLQSELQRSHHSEKDADFQKSHFESERNTWLKNNEDLNKELSDLRQLLSGSQIESETLRIEQKNLITIRDDEVKEFKIRLEEHNDELLNKDEEIEQLKKTIKNLSADLESSNKSAALVAKEEQKNKDLKQQLKKEEDAVVGLNNQIQMLNKQAIETDKSYRENMEKLNKQLSSQEENALRLDLKYKGCEKQLQDLGTLLQSKMSEIKDLNKKYSDSDEDLCSERERNNKTMERLNQAISSTITQYSNKEEILEPLQSIRKLINGLDTTGSSINVKSLPTFQDMDSSIELTKARSQIRVLQDQLDSMKSDFNPSREEPVISKKEVSAQSKFPLGQNYEIEMDRVDKIERMEKGNQEQLNDQSRLLRKTQQQMEVSDLTAMASQAEKDRSELIDEIRSLSDQLMKERQLKDSVTEQLVSVIKNPTGSISQNFGSKEFMFPSPVLNNGSSQWNLPTKNVEIDRKPFSTSMSNLSILKATVVEDEDLRQQMRKELDRSIAKHLESGRPIRLLNIKDKIRSLNVVRYPASNVVWKTQ